jgi:hypothetical protein
MPVRRRSTGVCEDRDRRSLDPPGQDSKDLADAHTLCRDGFVSVIAGNGSETEATQGRRDDSTP